MRGQIYSVSHIPRPRGLYYVYTAEYPEGFIDDSVDLSGIIFYVGKGTLKFGKTPQRMAEHESNARNNYPGDKCDVIRKIWESGKLVVWKIIFESSDRHQVLDVERSYIKKYGGPYLTNQLFNPLLVSETTVKRQDREKLHESLLPPEELVQLQRMRRAQVHYSHKIRLKSISQTLRRSKMQNSENVTVLRKYREELHNPKVSQEHMAKKSDLSLQTYQKMEAGKNAKLSSVKAIWTTLNEERASRGMAPLTLNEIFVVP